MWNQDIQVTLSSFTPFQRLTEYRVPSNVHQNDRPIAYAFVNSVAGSAFFIDYKIEEPVPPNSMFLFKASCNAGSLATWDCSAKNGYKGRAQWGLTTGNQAIEGGYPALMRMLFTFPQEFPTYTDPLSHWIRIDVFRVEHRARVPIDLGYDQSDSRQPCDASKGVHLMPGGYLGRRHPKRQYRYQLLDPKDKPFAAFVFYYRPFEQLKSMGIISDLSESFSGSFETSHECDSNCSISESGSDLRLSSTELSESTAAAFRWANRSSVAVAIQSSTHTDKKQKTCSPKKTKNSKNLRLSLTDDQNDSVCREKRPLSPFGPGGYLRNRLSTSIIPQTAPPKISSFQDLDECCEAQQAEKERARLRDEDSVKPWEKTTVHKAMLSPGQRAARERISGVVKGLVGKRLERRATEQNRFTH